MFRQRAKTAQLTDVQVGFVDGCIGIQLKPPIAGIFAEGASPVLDLDEIAQKTGYETSLKEIAKAGEENLDKQRGNRPSLSAYMTNAFGISPRMRFGSGDGYLNAMFDKSITFERLEEAAIAYLAKHRNRGGLSH